MLSDRANVGGLVGLDADVSRWDTTATGITDQAIVAKRLTYRRDEVANAQAERENFFLVNAPTDEINF